MGLLAAERAGSEGRSTRDGFPGWEHRFHASHPPGRLLFKANDFMLIDFEGEPARPASERCLERSCLSDVARMLRSFDDAVNTVLLDSGRRGALGPEDEPALELGGRARLHFVSARFLDAYLEPVQSAGLIPTGPRELSALLHSLLLDEAVYEMRYELENRPDWLQIPARGLRVLLAAHD